MGAPSLRLFAEQVSPSVGPSPAVEQDIKTEWVRTSGLHKAPASELVQKSFAMFKASLVSLRLTDL